MFKVVNSQVDFPALERELLEKWYRLGIVKKYLEKNKNSKDKFSFLDGPITANNPMGVHHAWGRTYKDFWQRFWNMKRKKQRFQNGFDEQGLWVEVEVEKELGLHSKKDIENLVSGDKFKSLEKFINLCKARVAKFSGLQTEQSKRLGYFMDWDNSYHTSSDENNYTIWNFLKVVHEKGWLYKGHDSVPWCPRCGTAISQMEILTEEYKEINHETIYFKLPIKGRANEFLIVWTTTPWTIPSNVAVAVNKKEDYSYYLVNGEKLWMIDKRIRELEKEHVLEGGEKSAERVKGSELIGWKYDGPFDDLPLISKTLKGYQHRVIDGEEIVTDVEGTGLLHVAPGAGGEDFKLGKKNDLPVITSIEEDASYFSSMGRFAGENAKKHPELIIDELKSKEGGRFLLTTQKYTHRYPTCWRCKTELVWRVVDEWYIAMDRPDKSGKTYREQMVEVAKKITWMPEWGLERELDWLKNMQDWLISKKRYWGLALPIWVCEKCSHFQVIGGKEELKDKAIEGWEKFDGNSPHRPWVDEVKIKCEKCGSVASRIPDVGNPWLDAGIVPYSTMPEDWRPADFITESFPGQFKNWFYALIAMSTALTSENPFKRVLGFGSVRDELGEEMHKSKGNSIEFNEAADKVGVDVMRWLYLRTNPEHNVSFGYKTLDEVRRMFIIKLWNVYSFFVTYANLNNWEPNKRKDFNSTNVLDQWILSRLTGAIKNMDKNISEYEAYLAMGHLENFIDDLSNWYVRRSRGRFGEGDEEGFETLFKVLTDLLKVMASITPFISDEIFTNITGEESVHLVDWPTPNYSWHNPELEKEMEEARRVVEAAHAQRKEAGIKVRQPLASLTTVTTVPLSDKVKIVVAEEVNVKEVKNETGKDTKVELDKNLTPELEAEGAARDLIRKIQEERKVLGTKLDEKVNVSLSDWPNAFEEEIKRKAQINSLTKGDFKVTKI